MDILRDKEHMEYFRDFLATKGEAKANVPLQFWLAVEDLKNSVHSKQKYSYKLKKIKDRFFRGGEARGMLFRVSNDKDE